jgi:hypothetical protein
MQSMQSNSYFDPISTISSFTRDVISHFRNFKRESRLKNSAKYLTKIAFTIAPLFLTGAVMANEGPTGKSYTGQNLAKFASIPITQARSIALKAHPGEIIAQELEKEKGGSGLRYSFDIKKDNVTYEVGIDAKTGKVLENAAEGKNPD